MTADREALIRACLDAPGDAAPRLVLADYLEEFAGLTAAQAAALRDGAGEWLLGPRQMVVWLFPDAHTASRFVPGDRNLVCVVPSQRTGLVVGDAPPDVWPSCRMCATPRDLRCHSGFWLCDPCRSGRRRNGRVSHVLADGPLLAGQMVTIGADGRVRGAKAADTVIGMAMGPVRADGTTEINLI